MGGEYKARDYGDVTPSELVDLVNEDIAEDTRLFGMVGYTGSWAEKKYLDVTGHVFNTKSEAEDMVLKNNDKWGPLTAVRYIATTEPKQIYHWYVGGWCSS